MSQIHITIDGKSIAGSGGETILQIAERNGVEIPTLCYHESVKLYGACGVCIVEAEGVPKLLRACATVATDGMVIRTDTERVRQSRKIALELLMSDHEGDCLGPCKLNCPANTDCQGYVRQIALGNDREAVRILKEKIPLPASIGRVCPHPCETACRRRLVEEPISIAYLKYFAADRDLHAPNPYTPDVAPESGKRVGVIGGGPGGLTAAYFLRLKGHAVTIFDAMPKMGGMLRYGIPEYRLPKAVLDAEIDAIARLGVRMENGVRIGRDMSLEALRREFDALVVAVGAWTSSGVGCKGETLSGVFGGIDFLRAVALGKKPDIGGSVAVVGGGNTAMDACRTALRLGAERVYVVYRRTEAEMPAEPLEIAEAKEEGVEFRFLVSPDEIIGENGRVCAMRLQVMTLGEPDASGRRRPVPVEGSFETLEVSSVIAAIGQTLNPAGFEALELSRRGTIAADENSYRTSLEGVFAVGDATNRGASIAIEAIGEAQRAACVIDAYLSGADAPYVKPYVSERELTAEAFADRERIARVRMPVRPAEERRRDFKEINLGLPEAEARREAARCLECGCHDYADCRLIRYANGIPGLNPSRLCGAKHPSFQEERLVCIERDQGKCILCGLCVRVCDEVAKKGILGLVDRGFKTVIKPEFNDPKVIECCLSCKKCAELCPTGALRIVGQ
ncbi:MAG: FAD-dependent oxidoreductase [Clostridia bacterium]|nr:FAD-dependent oxidoreductase [Clostridia bacterium]